VVLVKVIRKVNIMPIGKIIKEGAKLVKRGRKSKRGRPKKKVEVKKKQVVKRTDPYKITRLKGESDAAFKKRKAAIKKEVRESARETSKDQTPPKTSGGARDELGRLLSKHIPPSRKEMSKAQFRRLVKQGLIGVTKKGEVKNIGKFADIPENVMKELRGYTRKMTKEELEELKALGITERKHGSKIKLDKRKAMVPKEKYKKTTPKKFMTPKEKIDPDKFLRKLKTGGPIGIGAALRGYGKGYK
jgi:hypothetical protein